MLLALGVDDRELVGLALGDARDLASIRSKRKRLVHFVGPHVRLVHLPRLPPQVLLVQGLADVGAAGSLEEEGFLLAVRKGVTSGLYWVGAGLIAPMYCASVRKSRPAVLLSS